MSKAVHEKHASIKLRPKSRPSVADAWEPSDRSRVCIVRLPGVAEHGGNECVSVDLQTPPVLRSSIRLSHDKKKGMEVRGHGCVNKRRRQGKCEIWEGVNLKHIRPKQGPKSSLTLRTSQGTIGRTFFLGRLGCIQPSFVFPILDT